MCRNQKRFKSISVMFDKLGNEKNWTKLLDFPFACFVTWQEFIIANKLQMMTLRRSWMELLSAILSRLLYCSHCFKIIQKSLILAMFPFFVTFYEIHDFCLQKFASLVKFQNETFFGIFKQCVSGSFLSSKSFICRLISLRHAKKGLTCTPSYLIKIKEKPNLCPFSTHQWSQKKGRESLFAA